MWQNDNFFTISAVDALMYAHAFTCIVSIQ